MEKSWQDVLDKFHYGIYLVTITGDGGYNGMIASWVTQISHDPPLVALAIRKNRLSNEQIKNSGKFSINVLPKNLPDLVSHFKIPDWKKKFDGLEYEFSPHGTLVIKEALGYLDCSVEQTVDAGDHTLFIARITAGEMKRNENILSTAQYDGVYRGDR